MALAIKEIIKKITPFCLVEGRRRNLKLEMLGLDAHQGDVQQLAEAVELCRYELWPEQLRQRENHWVLVDVGANTGKFSQAVRRLATPSAIIAIEPQLECLPALKRTLFQQPATRIVSAVAGAESGQIALNRTHDTNFSSVLTPGMVIKGHYTTDAYDINDRVIVPVVTLDELLTDIDAVGLLKIDVQGYELEVLRGATLALRRTAAVLIEVNYVHHYDGAASFDEVHHYMSTMGFSLYGISCPYCSKGRPLWADAMYVNGAVKL